MFRFPLIVAAFFLLTSAGSVYAQNPLQCQVNIANTPTLPSESYTAATGDLTFFCSGGPSQSVGSALPQVNFQLFYNTAVTSRLFGGSNASEALLIIDDPGSPVGSYYGSTAANNPGR